MFKWSSNFQGKPSGKQKKEKRRLFHAKNFQSLMYPCFIFCRILGIFPYKMNASTFKASKPYIYILSTVVACVCGIYELITQLRSSFFGRIDRFFLPWTLANCCVIVFGSFIIIVSFILSGPRMRLLQIILKISSRLPSESYEELSKLIHAKDIIGFPLAGFILIFTPNTLMVDIHLLFYFYINLVVFQMDMLYINCVCVLKACFKRINDNLANMRRVVVNNEPHILRLNCHDQGNKFLIMELKALKRQHLAISDTVRMLNIIFSLQLLATIVMIFSNITGHVYYYIIAWKFFTLKNPINVSFHAYFLSSIVYMFIKIALIVWACETGKNQALQISMSIYDVFNNTSDEQIKNELQLFSLQTLHCDNRFSAKGFIVDAKLLAMIVGSITTYVIILFQFKNLSYSCERKTTNNNTEVI